MSDPISVAQLSALVRSTSMRLELLVTQLNVEQMNQPGAVGVWSVKDVLVHVAFWERYAVDMLRAIQRGETPVLVADDATERYNASVVTQYYQRALSAVIADWHAVREDLLDCIEDLSDEDLHDMDRFPWNAGRTLLDHIATSSYAHEQEHIDQIRAWMKRPTSDE